MSVSTGAASRASVAAYAAVVGVRGHAAEPVGQRRVLVGRLLGEVERERGAAGRVGDVAQLRQGQRDPARQPVEQVPGAGPGRSEVDGRHQRL